MRKYCLVRGHDATAEPPLELDDDKDEISDETALSCSNSASGSDMDDMSSEEALETLQDAIRIDSVASLCDERLHVMLENVVRVELSGHDHCFGGRGKLHVFVQRVEAFIQAWSEDEPSNTASSYLLRRALWLYLYLQFAKRHQSLHHYPGVFYSKNLKLLRLQLGLPTSTPYSRYMDLSGLVRRWLKHRQKNAPLNGDQLGPEESWKLFEAVSTVEKRFERVEQIFYIACSWVSLEIHDHPPFNPTEPCRAAKIAFSAANQMYLEWSRIMMDRARAEGGLSLIKVFPLAQEWTRRNERIVKLQTAYAKTLESN